MIELTDKTKKTLKKIGIILFVIYIFGLCFIWSKTILYNNAPDEKMKYDVCQYICNNLKLPHGGDESIRDEIWGISYAFTPILSYMISAVFMRITMFFTQNDFAIVVAARFVSVLSMVGYTIMSIKISSKLFKGVYKWLFIVFLTLLPQVVYLGSYLNNDSLALFSISVIVYSWIIGLEKNWDWKSCTLLGIGIGVCALSYYNAYGYILCSIILYIVSCFIKKINIKEFLKKGIVISAIVLLISGWWFIRNFILYDGDFFGLDVSREYGEKYAQEQFKPSNRPTPEHQNMSLKVMLIDNKWIINTVESAIGVFGYMSTRMLQKTYYAYETVFVLGIFGAIVGWIIQKIKNLINKNKKEEKFQKTKKSEERLFNIIMIICIIIRLSTDFPLVGALAGHAGRTGQRWRARIKQ